MLDLKIQYGEKEVRHLMALKELSGETQPENHEEEISLKDQDGDFAQAEALIEELQQTKI